MVTSILHLNRKCITFYTKAQKIIGLLTQKKKHTKNRGADTNSNDEENTCAL